MYRPKPSHLRWLLAALVVVMLAVCLWPFEFHPRNEAILLPQEQSLRFTGKGLVRSREVVRLPKGRKDDNGLVIDVTVRPAGRLASGVPCILSFAAQEGPVTLVLGAWKKSLIVRLGHPGRPQGKGYQEIGLPNVFAAGSTVRLTVVLDDHGATVLIDGRFRRFLPAKSFDTAVPPPGWLLLGNTITGNAPWMGDIRHLELHSCSLPPPGNDALAVEAALHDCLESDDGLLARYRFDKAVSAGRVGTVPAESRLLADERPLDLLVPPHFAPLRRTVLGMRRPESLLTMWSLQDVLLNVLGFVPLGFLAMVVIRAATTMRPQCQATLAVLAGFLLSLLAELVQVFLPARSSSLADLATNTFGCALGALAFFMRAQLTEHPEDSDEHTHV